MSTTEAKLHRTIDAKADAMGLIAEEARRSLIRKCDDPAWAADEIERLRADLGTSKRQPDNDDPPIPCDVTLASGTTFGAGVKLSTLLGALKRRGMGQGVIERREIDHGLRAAIQSAREAGSAVTVHAGNTVFVNDGTEPDYSHLNCTACGGSGHVEDVTAAHVAEVVVEDGESKIRWTIEDPGNYPAGTKLFAIPQPTFVQPLHSDLDSWLRDLEELEGWADFARAVRERMEELERDAARYRLLENDVCWGYPSAEGCRQKDAYLVVTGIRDEDLESLRGFLDEKLKEELATAKQAAEYHATQTCEITEALAESLAREAKPRDALTKIATFDHGCDPVHCTCCTGMHAEIELEERMQLAADDLALPTDDAAPRERLRQERERCAKVADKHAKGPANSDLWSQGFDSAASSIASAIRAMEDADG